jgi:hypothetical protein
MHFVLRREIKISRGPALAELAVPGPGYPSRPLLIF